MHDNGLVVIVFLSSLLMFGTSESNYYLISSDGEQSSSSGYSYHHTSQIGNYKPWHSYYCISRLKTIIHSALEIILMKV